MARAGNLRTPLTLHPMNLRREYWNGPPVELGIAWTLKKRNHIAQCILFSHQFGWELRLTVNGSLVRSQVSRVVAEVVDAADEWQRAMREEGWELAVL